MISVQGLVKRHGDTEVLKGISLDVPKGQVDAILGPSGGGKSTFLRCLNGLEPFQGGQVRVGTHTLTADTHARRDADLLQSVRKTVGCVFQTIDKVVCILTLKALVECERF